ncbi:unnamed protein product [Acanthoscelides obtectus]|nr:unnamed protein product [Acanthoscelides obtectus]CAK1631867.1 hypothetical protein AOBTE_LOCUS7214 [Acanthoscelides obtectus]
MMAESAIFCNRFMRLTFLSYVLVGVLAHISAQWKLKSEQKGIYFQGNSTCYDFLPYVFMIPFDDGSIHSCEFALSFMDFSFCIMSSYIAGYDAIFCCFLKCLDTHLQILSAATKNIRERLLSKGNMAIDYEMQYDDSVPNLEQEMYEEIKKCNHHLSFLLRIVQDIDGIFSFPMLLQIITSMFLMASNLFVASMLSPFEPEFYSLVEFMLASLGQLCMVCHFCGRITESGVRKVVSPFQKQPHLK